MRKKYAMVAINRKHDEKGRLHYRRVLISYKGKPVKEKVNNNIVKIIYRNTRIVDVDPYFKNETSSHRYAFENDGYSLVDCAYDYASEILEEKRPYHSYIYSGFDICDWSDGTLKITGSSEFKAKSDEEAIKIFNERKELR